MIDGLKPYAARRDSGLPWLGELPAHWPALRLKTLVSNVVHQAERVLPDDYYIALEHVESWTGRIKESSAAAVEGQVKRFRAGDLLFGKLRPYLAKVARPSRPGVCVGEFLVLRPTVAEISGAYLEYLLRSAPFIAVVNSSTFGGKIPRAGWTLVGSFRVPYPPLDEQAAIVRFLDHADRRIRRYIRAKKKLIALLNEQKQAVLEAVLASAASGSSNRLRVRLKHIAVIQTGITLGKNYGKTPLIERPYLRVANVKAGRIDLSRIKTVRVPEAEAQRSTLRAGDVLMTEGGDRDKLGRGCVWNGEIPDCLHQNHIFAVRPDSRFLLPPFLVACMASRAGRDYFEMTAKQTTNLAATNSATVGNLPLVLPPVDLQAALLKRIEERLENAEAAERRALHEVELLIEYRNRLIADLVTGHLDVRDAAKRLPEESAEIEGLEADEEAAESIEDLEEPIAEEAEA